MPKTNLAHVLSRFVHTPLMIHPPKLEVIVKALEPRLNMIIDETGFASLDEKTVEFSASKYNGRADYDPYEVHQGVAVIPVKGVLTKKLSGLRAMSGGCCYASIEEQLRTAMEDNSVHSVLLDIDSPGGETTGCFELADYIHSLRGDKPLYAVADDCAASAAYAIASCADKIFVTQTGGVGSVGVYALHTDQSEYDKKLGVKYSYIFAGDKKVEGNPHEPLSEEARSDIQAEVDREYEMFTQAVARNRNAKVKDVKGTQARMFFGENALGLLADQVGTFDDAMSELLTKFSGKTASAVSSKRGKKAMNPEEQAKIAAEAEAQAKAKAEQEAATTKLAQEQEAKRLAEEALAATKAEKEELAKQALNSRSTDDIAAITNLCKLAGQPDKLATFLGSKNAAGTLMSLTEISQELVAARAKESEKGIVDNHVNNNATGKVGISQLEAQAKQFANQNRMTVTGRLYGQGERKGTTPEQAYAQMLENNPEVYAEYRDQHNAKAMLATLQRAGIKISQ